MKLEIVCLDGLSAIADVERIDRGEIWFHVGSLSEAFGLPVAEFLEWPLIEEFLTALLIDRGLTDPSDTEAYFCQFVRVSKEGRYQGVWLSSPLAMEFVGACRPVLRYRLQQWLAAKQAIDRRFFVEAGHDSVIH